MNKYLVLGTMDGDEFSKIMTAAEIFKMMDMADCMDDFDICVWKINSYTEALSKCTVRGVWHDPSDPLKMVIVGDGIREIGYGTNH